MSDPNSTTQTSSWYQVGSWVHPESYLNQTIHLGMPSP